MGGRTKTHSNPNGQKAKKHVVYFRLVKSFGEPVTEIGEIKRSKEKNLE